MLTSNVYSCDWWVKEDLTCIGILFDNPAIPSSNKVNGVLRGMFFYNFNTKIVLLVNKIYSWGN